MPTQRLNGWVPQTNWDGLNAKLKEYFNNADQADRVQFVRTQFGGKLDLPAPDTVSLVAETATLPLASSVPGYRVTTQGDLIVIPTGTDTIDGYAKVSVAGGAEIVSDGVSWIVLHWGAMGRYDIRKYGAIGDYVSYANQGTDSTAAIQACIDAIEASRIGGLLCAGEGGFRHGALRVRQFGTHVLGRGDRATFFVFDPTIPNTAGWTLSTTPTVGIVGTTLYQCSFRHIAFRGMAGNPAARAKIGINLICTSECVVEYCSFNDWTTSAGHVADGPSIFVLLNGKEMTTLRNVSGSGDRPISIEANPKERSGPAGPIDCDFLRIENFYVGTSPGTLGAGDAAIYVAPGLNFLRCTMSGSNLQAGFKYGLYWHDPAGTFNGSNHSFKNYASEQCSDPLGAMILIERQGTGKSLSIELDNINCSNESRGIVLEGVSGTRISGGGFFRFTSQSTSPMALTLAATARQTIVTGFLIPLVGGGTSLVSLAGGLTAYPVSTEPLSEYQLHAITVFD